MSETVKEAIIRLKLDSTAYKTDLLALDRPAQEAGLKSGSAFSSSFSAGLKGAKSAVEGLLSSVKTGMLAFSGVAGIAGVATLASHALHAEGAFKKLAFQVQAGSGQIINFRDAMEKAKSASVAWGKDVDELGGAMSKMFEETGKIDVAEANIGTVAMVARASREPVEALGAAAGMLSKKFKIANADMGDSLGVLLSAANKGGLSFDELSGRLGYIGAIAKSAGLEGKQGLSQIVGMLNVGEESSKNLRKALGTVSSIVEEFGKKPARNKMMMQLGIDPSSVKGGLDESLRAVIAKTGGSKEKLQVAFKNEAQVEFLVDMGKSYRDAFAATTGDVKTKTKAGLDAYDAAMKHAAKSSMDEATMKEIATKNMQGGAAKMEQAMEKLKAAFMRPEVTTAIGKLADILPLLVEKMVGALDFFVKHPVLGGAAVVGGVVAKGAAGPLLTGLISAATSSGAAAGSAAAAAAGPAAVAASTSVYAAGAAALAVPLAAFAAAAGGVALAVDQGMKLAKELEPADAVDAQGKKVNTLGPKEGATKGIWEELKHDVGITSDKEFDQYWANKMGRSVSGEKMVGGDAESRTFEHMGATGASSAAYGSWEDNQKRLGRTTGKPSAKAAPPPVAAPHVAAARSKEDAALFASMMAEKTLKVKIDAGDIAALQKAMSGGGGGGPAPGYVDRP